MVPGFYGNTVCLVAVITFLISITTPVNAVIDLGDPMHAGYTPAESPAAVNRFMKRTEKVSGQTFQANGMTESRAGTILAVSPARRKLIESI